MSGKRKPGVLYAGRDILVSIQNEREWADFCRDVLRRPDLLSHPQFASNAVRVENRPLVDGTVHGPLSVPGGMVTVPAGEFIMGSDPRKDPAAGPQEQPLHRVTLDAFEIDRYEVSNVEYLRFVLSTGASWPQFWRAKPFPDKMATHPVINVSWQEADAYCRWAGRRLPS